MGSSVFDSIDPSAVIYHYDPTGFTSPTWLGIQTEIIVNAALIFTANYDETTSSWSYSVSDCDTAASGKMFIPSTFNGLPVTSIGYRAFDRCSSLTSMTIPDGVTSIERETFYKCTSLTNITIPDSVTSIGEWAFANCSSLKNITFEGNAPSMTTSAFEDFQGLIALPQECIIYYYEGATGFTSPTWQGIQTETIYRTSAFTLGIEKQGTGFELWFNAANGVSYRIEYSTDLENWFTLEDNIPGTGGEVVRYYDTVGTQKRFYRAKRND